MQGDDPRWVQEWDTVEDCLRHEIFRDALGEHATIPMTQPAPGVSLDAALVLQLLREQADHRGVIVGDPVLLLAERLGWPHDRSLLDGLTGSSDRVLAHSWLDHPLAELEQARLTMVLGDGLRLARRVA